MLYSTGSKLWISIANPTFWLVSLASCILEAIYHLAHSLAEKNGRKLFLILGNVIQAIAFLTMILIENTYVYLIAMFVIGFTVPMKNIIGVSHLLELIPGKESLVSGILFCWEGACFIYCPAILLFVTIDTKVFLYMAFGISAFCSLTFAVFYFPESISYSLD
jgi:uncharacterized membrane protein YesL